MTMKPRCGLTATLVIAVAMTLLAGCGDDDPSKPNSQQPAWQPPLDGDTLMDQFKRAYSEMDIEDYERILSADFEFIFQQSDVEHLGLLSDRLTRAQEVRCSTNMFSGHGGTENHPISAIAIDILAPETAWQEVLEDVYFPGTTMRVYRIIVRVERPTSVTIEVQGLVEFYATYKDTTLANGDDVEFWQLRGVIDRTMGTGWKDAGSGTWGALKNLYGAFE
jgi:hypothetical protein